MSDTRNALALSVAFYTRALRDAGTPPERTVVLVKTLLDDACGGTNIFDAHVLRADMVKWCIDAYFAA